MDATINWFNGTDYQLWSMANNNNGSKIRNTIGTYKYVAREYIHNYDKNDWYFHFKTKLESLGNLLIKGKAILPWQSNLALSKDYEMLSMDDATVRDYFRHHIINYKIDWE